MTDCKNGNNTFDEKNQLAVFEEYKILQDKIDKIGDFRFRVKGWTITMIVAVIFTSFSAGAPSWLMLFAIPLIFMFKSLEDFQDTLQDSYVKRVIVLEKYLSNYYGRDHLSTPAIGRAVIKAFWHAKKNVSVFQRFSSWASSNFYILLLILIVLVVLAKWFFVSDIDIAESREAQKIII